jgi:hypothetical protein
MTSVRGLAAVVFVALFGYFLAGPVLRSDDDAGPGPRAVVPTPAPRPEATRSAPGAESPTRLLTRYPRACLRPVARPEGTGLVAAYNVDGSHGEQVVVATVEGETVATIRDPAPIVRPPIGWSASGRYLATGEQGLFWTADGEAVLIGDVQHGMVSGLRGTWAWSPIADCGLAIVNGALHVVGVDPFVTVGPSRELLPGGVLHFAFTPDGGSAVVAIERPAGPIFLTADLRTGRIRRGGRPLDTVCRVCSPTGDFRVGIRKQRLALLDASDAFLRYVTDVETENGVWGESVPEWGPAGTGVLFERHMHLINQLWFLPESASEPHFVAHLEPVTALAGLFDWSVTAPTGRPVR